MKLAYFLCSVCPVVEAQCSSVLTQAVNQCLTINYEMFVKTVALDVAKLYEIINFKPFYPLRAYEERK